MINIITGSSSKNLIFLDGSNCLSIKNLGPVLGIHSPYRPILVEEMKNVLEDRKNHITERFYIDGSDVVFEKFDGGSNRINLDKDLYAETRGELRKIHGGIFSSQETTIYSSSEITFDLINDSVVVDLVDWDEYTCYVGIKKIRQFAKKPNIAAKVDLSVKYSLNDSDHNIGSEDLTFCAFKYDENSNLTCESFITDLDCGIRVEYSDSTIRVTPIDPNVRECIISNCVVSYGNFKHKES